VESPYRKNARKPPRPKKPPRIPRRIPGEHVGFLEDPIWCPNCLMFRIFFGIAVWLIVRDMLLHR